MEMNKIKENLLIIWQNILATVLFPFITISLLSLIFCSLILVFFVIIEKLFTNKSLMRKSKYIKKIESVYYFLDNVFRKITGN